MSVDTSTLTNLDESKEDTSSTSALSSTTTISTTTSNNDSDEKHETNQPQEPLRIAPGTKLDDDIPTTLPMTPAETKLLEFDSLDNKIKSLIIAKFEHEYKQFKHFPTFVISCFVIAFRHNHDETARIQETLTKFDKFLQFYRKCHFDDVFDPCSDPNSHKNNKNDSKNEKNDKNSDKNTQNSDKTGQISEESMYYKHQSILVPALKGLPHFLYGFDKEGHPVYWQKNTCFVELFEAFKDNNNNLDLDKFNAYNAGHWRRFFNLKMTLGKYYNTTIFYHTAVIDCGSLKIFETVDQFRRHYHFFVSFFGITTDLFAESVYRLFMINAPYAFRLAMNIGEKIIVGETKRKIYVYGTDYLDYLKEHIDIKMIPKEYGGEGKWEVTMGASPNSFPFNSTDEYLPFVKDVLNGGDSNDGSNDTKEDGGGGDGGNDIKESNDKEE